MIRRYIAAAGLAAALLLGLGCAAAAQDVTLTSRDGGVRLSGQLITFDGEFYRIDTPYGELVVDGQGAVCDGPGCPDLDAYIAEFRISGAPVMGRVLLPALIEAFAQRRGLAISRDTISDDVRRYTLRQPQDDRTIALVELHLTSTAEGFADMLAGEADLVMAAREATEAELTLAREAGLGDLGRADRARVVALDALVPAVAPSNPMTEIALADLLPLLAGTVTTWPGRDDPVVLHGGPKGNALDQALTARLQAPAGLSPAPDPRRHDSDIAQARALARDPYGLAVLRLSALDGARALWLTGSCGMPIRATPLGLKTEDYPFTMPLMLYRPGKRLPLLARDFLAYLDTPAAQLVIRRAGFVDQSRASVAIEDQGVRLANAIVNAGDNLPLSEVQRMVRALQGAERLSTTFRFRGGSAALDAQSAGNVTGLARALEAGLFDGRELIFVGFSDGEGGWEANRRIARDRAQTVQKAVRAAATGLRPGRTEIRVLGFGEALPMACDDTDWGRGMNRRVEVWLR